MSTQTVYNCDMLMSGFRDVICL